MKWIYMVSYLLFFSIIISGITVFNIKPESSNFLILLFFPSILSLLIPYIHRPFKLPEQSSSMSPRIAYSLIQSLKTKILPKQDFIRLTQWATRTMKIRPSLVYIPTRLPTTVIGDVHGQYEEIVQVFSQGINNRQYLFNGDYVDRGKQGIEVITALMGALCSSPETIFLARGNHEDPELHWMYGFKNECLGKYDTETYQVICEFFKSLPYAHVIGTSVFVVHGGIPPQPITLNDINNLPRGNIFMQDANVPELAANLLWSDPQNNEGACNSIRGIGCKFGPDIVNRFLSDNNLSLIIRSHEVKTQGFEYTENHKVLTIFSASHYGGGRNNAAVAQVMFTSNFRSPKVDIVVLGHGVLPVNSETPHQVILAILAIIFIVLVDYLMVMLS
ncbi:hypothetical protein ENUP19_0266G0022 [Entamoeba nuttalli]|uniref:Serine/threonine protein phosphatase type 5, putative n=2 Tax=Entamoeba nuttalli TaxID=412467 RepID=K2GRM8_ENTNP|nr:serine/threonine protein phosphatase type 5, putative [Entamoeba nuttalli P19]EKE37593.1 serine/threonine protein phosphatase type 5, putative [Entamoeba nuttalli P19]|eukprot:XP_008860071.1 serine/threonine protein phosphatase type 5, putative [Entamoeba nuttalli P19]